MAKRGFSTGATFAVLAGSIVGGLALVTLLDKKRGGGGCTSNSECPPGFICVGGQCVISTGGCTTNNDCPTGYICQNGVCVKGCGLTANCACGQCSPTNCACNQCWSQTDCQCEPLTIDRARVPSFIPVSQGWASRSNPGMFGGFNFTTGQDPFGYHLQCPPTAPLTGEPNQPFSLDGTAVDPGGHPICNTPILINILNPGPLPWVSNDGNWMGTLQFGFNPPNPGPLVPSTTITTGGDGTFNTPAYAEISLDINLTTTALDINCSFPLNSCSNPAYYITTIDIPVSYTTPNNVTVEQLIQYQTSICCYNS